MSNPSKTPAPSPHMIAITLIFLGSLGRVISFMYSANSGGDAGARVALVAAWLQKPTLKVVFDTYPPGHFYLIALFALVTRNVVIAGRLLSLVLGIASLPIIWKLARLLYGEWAGVLSVSVFSFYSLHIGYSTTSSAEVSYVFFFLLGIYLLFSVLGEGNLELGRLALSGICLSVSQSIKFEAWVLFGALFVGLAVWLLVAEGAMKWRTWWKPLLVFGITGGAWPVFMMAYSHHVFGDPMYLISWTRVRVTSVLTQHSLSRFHEMAVMASALLLGVSPIAIAGGVWGVILSFSRRLTAFFASVIIFFAAIEFYELYNGGTVAVARYTITLGTLLAVISGFGIDSALRKLSANRILVSRIVVMGLLLANCLLLLAGSEIPNSYSEKLLSVSPRLRYPARIKAVGDYLRSHLGPQDAVVIDDYNVESNVIADAAGLPVPRGQRAYLVSNKHSISVVDYINTEHPRLLVYADGGVLSNTINLPTTCQEAERIDGIVYECVFAGQVYRVYKLSYQ